MDCQGIVVFLFRNILTQHLVHKNSIRLIAYYLFITQIHEIFAKNQGTLQRAGNKSLQVVLNDRKDHNTQEHRLLHLLAVCLDQNGGLLSIV